MTFALLLFFGCFLAGSAPAQAPVTNTEPQPEDRKQEQRDDDVQTFKVSVDVVNVFFNVKDKRGGLVPSLPRDDFELYEDGQKQTIKYFSTESNQPLTLGLLIDSSASQQRVLGMEQEVGSQFLAEVLGPKDMAFVIGFDVNVDLLQDYTNSRRELKEALYRAKINNGGGFGGAGVPGIGGGPVPTSRPRGTLLYDAVYLAADEKLGREVGRKAMIILTDGVDQGSQETLKQAIEAAQRADAICYVLLISDRGFYGHGGFTYSGDREMKDLSEQTGGRVIEVGNKYEKLKEAFDQIQAELRSQYSIGYTPTNTKRDGTFRKVEIRSKQGHKVQARRGYYALQQ
ncbi:MAG: VWA domain-containing protein [Candidatus Koribacter versatilis]|uniref:VWA domain-containing protein n=1 Tax=Candidatus Korobacter versatilis TaxID=658062 RepID=A0A932A9X0_9BACT|nr:VWA domain-containing protein [Candidatus Koribacter versatilis]